jgi:predicted hydrocarbon binding protein
MFSVRGLVLMSRLEYFESKYGVVKYKEFLKKISSDEVNFSRQTVDGAHIYSDRILAKIDQILLEEYLNNDINEFFKMGKWNADNLIYRYFSLYVDNSEPHEFLAQYARLRDYFIGSGDMTAQIIDKNNITIAIDYGQAISKSICLSEQGFIEGGLEQCGATHINIKETACASESDNLACHFEISFDLV